MEAWMQRLVWEDGERDGVPLVTILGGDWDMLVQRLVAFEAYLDAEHRRWRDAYADAGDWGTGGNEWDRATASAYRDMRDAFRRAVRGQGDG
jgi:hypothetical protein